MKRVVWSPSALREVSHIFDHIAEFHPTAASEVAGGLIEAGDSLTELAERGRPVSGTDLRELVTTYPYIIRYRIVRDEVRVLPVRHTSRRPTNP